MRATRPYDERPGRRGERGPNRKVRRPLRRTTTPSAFKGFRQPQPARPMIAGIQLRLNRCRDYYARPNGWEALPIGRTLELNMRALYGSTCFLAVPAFFLSLLPGLASVAT